MDENSFSNKYKRHDAKRKRLSISLYKKDLAKMKSKFGKILTAAQAKEALLTGEYTERIVVIKDNPTDVQLMREMIKIGNNLNQIAHVSNSEKKISLEARLLNEITELNNLRIKIRNQML